MAEIILDYSEGSKYHKAPLREARGAESEGEEVRVEAETIREKIGPRWIEGP